MIYTVEKPLSQFEFWSGAKQRTDHLTTEQLDQLDYMIPDILGEKPTDTAINDLFWFEEDYIAQLLGFKNWDALERYNDGEDEEDEDEGDTASDET